MKTFILEDSHSRMVLFADAIGWDNITTAADVTTAQRRYKAEQPFDLILLDHDLEDSHYASHYARAAGTHTDHPLEGTGVDFAKWLARQYPTCRIVIHSYNPDGAKRMEQLLKDADCNVDRIPFGLTLLDWLVHEKGRLDNLAAP